MSSVPLLGCQAWPGGVQVLGRAVNGNHAGHGGEAEPTPLTHLSLCAGRTRVSTPLPPAVTTWVSTPRAPRGLSPHGQAQALSPCHLAPLETDLGRACLKFPACPFLSWLSFANGRTSRGCQTKHSLLSKLIGVASFPLAFHTRASEVLAFSCSFSRFTSSTTPWNCTGAILPPKEGSCRAGVTGRLGLLSCRPTCRPCLPFQANAILSAIFPPTDSFTCSLWTQRWF